jgi:site-specific DNA-cytosine methylase
VRQELITGSPDLSPWLQQTAPTTVNDAIGDLPPLENGEDGEGKDYTPATTPYVQQMRTHMAPGELHDHRSTRHSEYVIERFKKIPEGENWMAIRSLLTSTYTNVENTHSNIYRRLHGDRPAITISHFRKSMIIHPSQDRGLSFREACRLQSFPDWYRFYGRRDERTQQLANAVPPLLAQTIATALLQYIATQPNLLMAVKQSV